MSVFSDEGFMDAVSNLENSLPPTRQDEAHFIGICGYLMLKNFCIAMSIVISSANAVAFTLLLSRFELPNTFIVISLFAMLFVFFGMTYGVGRALLWEGTKPWPKRWKRF